MSEFNVDVTLTFHIKTSLEKNNILNNNQPRSIVTLDLSSNERSLKMKTFSQTFSL
jgi:hypothetical protein